jgi:hypothetical protein
MLKSHLHWSATELRPAQVTAYLRTRQNKTNPEYRNFIFYSKEGGIMTDLRELNKDTPAAGKNDPGSASDDAAQSHRRVERETDKAAERGKDRQQKNDSGEFSNVGPA